jgi:hypothetical protein
MSPYLLSGQDVAFATFPRFLAVLAASASVVIGEMTASTSHNFKVGRPEALAKRTVMSTSFQDCRWGYKYANRAARLEITKFGNA